MISVFCMIPVFLAYLGIIYSPDNKLWIDLVLFGVIGFFVYPAILLLVVSALDYTSKKAVGTAAGFIGLFGYLGRVTESKGIGALVPRYGWNFALYAIMASAFMGIVLLSWMWKLSPRRAEEIAPPGLSRHSAKNKSDV
jgi:OPA family glycerol-3-phosphate transporter-like MFS transporter